MRKINYYILLLLVTGVTTFSNGQGIIISSGAHLAEDNGYLILKGNWINNGSFTHTDGILIFAGTTQSLEGSSSAQFKNITVASGSSTTITSSGQTLSGILVSDGTLNADGNITLLSNASQTALIDGTGTGEVLGNITMQRYLPSGFGYKYFSSPFQAATVNEFSDEINLADPFPPLYRFDESRTSAGWVSYVTPANVLNPLEGYAINFGSSSLPLTADVTGAVNNGNQSRTLYNNNNTYTQGFNLAGNPYPSPIDWDAATGWTKTNIDDALYYFRASATDQYGGTYSSYVSGVSSDGLATNIIPSMQGFFVHVTDGAYPVTGTLGMDNGVRVNDLTHSFIKSDGKNSKPMLRLTAGFSDTPGLADPVVVYFDEKATGGFDSYLDALKLMNSDINVPNLYAIGTDNSKLSINSLPLFPDSLCSVLLALNISRKGQIIFRITYIEESLADLRVYLSDIVEGEETDLLPEKEYILNLDAGEYLNRFFLNLSSAITLVPEVPPGKDMFTIYNSQSVLKAEIEQLPGGDGTLIIYSMTGLPHLVNSIYNTGYYEFPHNLSDGIYIATLVSGNMRQSKKIIIIRR